MRTYTYDNEGRSDRITKNSLSIVNTYDPLGQRIKKTVGTQFITYVYNEDGQLIGEYDTNNVMLREYIWLGDRLVGMQSSQYPNQVLRVNTDHLGTVRAVSLPNATNTVLWRWEGDQFGDVLPNEDVDANGQILTMPLRHPGQYYDAEVGTFYNYFRDYNPATGRYVESDPIGLDGGINTYAYVNGSPVDTIDPTGEFGLAGAAWGGGIDLGLQLIMNGGKFKCVNWKEVGAAAAGGALGVGLLNGIGKLKKGSNTWSATSKWLRGKNGPGGPYSPKSGNEYHHWAIEQNSALGKRVPNVIKNQPWNLNPIPKETHNLIHGNAPGGAQYGILMRWWQGTPGWAKGVEMGGGTAVLAPGDQGDDCECQ